MLSDRGGRRIGVNGLKTLSQKVHDGNNSHPKQNVRHASQISKLPS